MSLIRSSKTKTTPAPVLALEDIDYLLGVQRLAEISTSLEADQADITHAYDIVESLENLDCVIESLQEIDVIDAALIEVVGNIAGASTGAPAHFFTPSMEATADTAPSMQARIKVILEKIIEMLRVIFTKIKTYIAHLFSQSHMLATRYEKLGDKIREFNFVQVKPLTIRDIPGAKGGPKAILSGLTMLEEATKKVLTIAPLILEAQLDFIYDQGKSEADYITSSEFKTIAEQSLKASQGLHQVKEGHFDNAVFESKPLLNSLKIQTEVFLSSTAKSTEPRILLRQAFSARTGFQYDSEEVTPTSSVVAMTHETAKDLFEGIRYLMHSLTSQSSADSFTAKLESMSKDVQKLENWVREQQKTTEQALGASLSSMTDKYYLFLSSQLLGTKQLADFIRSHKLLTQTVQVVMSYIDHCLTSPRAATPSA